VTFFDERLHVADLRAELHLFDLDDDLFLLGVVGLLLLFVLEAAVVHDLADRRLRHRVDLDEVEPFRAGLLERCFDGQHSELLTLGPHNAYFTCADAAVRSLIACDG
jgi:hypothetical protein